MASQQLASLTSSLYVFTPLDDSLPLFVDLDQSKYSCTMCGKLLREPMQTECGHRMCRVCVDEKLERIEQTNDAGEMGFWRPAGEEDCAFITQDGKAIQQQMNTLTVKIPSACSLRLRKLLSSSVRLERLFYDMIRLRWNRDKIDSILPDLNTSTRSGATSTAGLHELSAKLQAHECSDYSRRYEDAVEQKVISLYNQPFHTSKYGYRMCTRLYLDGDGLGHGTHSSLFFVVMKGEFDDILQWPFKQRVTMMMQNQKNLKRPLTDTFKPDLTCSSRRSLRRFKGSAKYLQEHEKKNASKQMEQVRAQMAQLKFENLKLRTDFEQVNGELDQAKIMLSAKDEEIEALNRQLSHIEQQLQKHNKAVQKQMSTLTVKMSDIEHMIPAVRLTPVYVTELLKQLKISVNRQ